VKILYNLQKHSFLVNPQVDKKNSYYSLAYDSKNARTLAINPGGYLVLALLFEKPAVTFDELRKAVKERGVRMNDEVLKAFLRSMVKNNIVYVKKT